MNKVIITKNGEPLNAPIGFHPDPQSETGPVGGPVSGTEGNHPKKAFDAPIVAQYVPNAKTFSTLQAQAARAGFELTTSHHDKTGLTLWQVARWGQSRQFSEWGDVCNFIAHIGGFRHG